MNSEETNVVITSALRTAIGTFDGSLKNIQAHNLGSIVVKETIKKSKLKFYNINSQLKKFERMYLCYNFTLLGNVIDPVRGSC